jgi:hypothetical protein
MDALAWVEWVAAHWDDIAAALAAAGVVVNVVVKLTPWPEDDQWVRRAMLALAVVGPKGHPGMKLPGRMPKGLR